MIISKPIVCWRGYNDTIIFDLIRRAWEGKIRLLLFSPTSQEIQFVNEFPHGPVEFVGDWSGVDVDGFVPNFKSHLFPDDPCFGIFTSGTTESTKLVIYSHNNILSCAQNIFDLFERKRLKQIFCYPQAFHTFGLTLGFVSSLILDIPLVSPLRRYSSKAHELWNETVDEGTLTLGTPTHFYDLISYNKKHGLNAPTSYASIIGGAKVAKELWHESKSLLNIESPSIGYGATEASPGVTHLPPGQEPICDGDVGTPLKHLKTKVSELGVDFSGASLCLATVQDENFETPSEYNLPDLIEIHESGSWVYKTRLKWMLNRGGKKMDLESLDREVQKELQLDVLSFPVKDQRLGQELGLLLKVDPEDFEEVQKKVHEYIKRRYDMNFDKTKFVAVKQFPRNESQKLDRSRAIEYLL